MGTKVAKPDAELLTDSPENTKIYDQICPLIKNKPLDVITYFETKQSVSDTMQSKDPNLQSNEYFIKNYDEIFYLASITVT